MMSEQIYIFLFKVIYVLQLFLISLRFSFILSSFYVIDVDLFSFSMLLCVLSSFHDLYLAFVKQSQKQNFFLFSIKRVKHSVKERKKEE